MFLEGLMGVQSLLRIFLLGRNDLRADSSFFHVSATKKSKKILSIVLAFSISAAMSYRSKSKAEAPAAPAQIAQQFLAHRPSCKVALCGVDADCPNTGKRHCACIGGMANKLKPTPEAIPRGA